MFLSENYHNLGNGFVKLDKNAVDVKFFYHYWKETLFERCMRLFKWECGDIPQKEIEQRLLLTGFCIITKNKDGKLVCASGGMYEQNIYYDEFKKVTYNLVGESGERTIGKDCVLISNNSLRNSLFHMIHNYSMMLAHTEVSIICELVNIRSHKTFSAKNKAVAKTVNQWYKNLFDGKMTSIMDDYTCALTNFDNRTSSTNLPQLLETRQNILKAFYNDIGIKTNYDKKERMNVEETALDEGLLLINISDMYDFRKKACEDVKKVFGLDWTVKKSIEYENNDQDINDTKKDGVSDDTDD